MDMTPDEKRVFSETYTQVFVKRQVERSQQISAGQFTDPFYRGAREHGQEEDAAVATHIATATVLRLRAALAAHPPESSKPSRPTGGFEHL